ncbi:metal ABC transporter ATP-binding protein [Oligosphaera ethanolica]|uniref:ABC-type Mn2+/Zn2+ transport system ATPase subunit n=1 Tax=Oligosphaera ethanolica TaxID=760260 RepID=A0AAE3VHT7_9BACT|nr:ATP-binding cassette domain-containing protein [Oligosphaera ethanolica]MDQ0290748.1 ABC-type Mn2+/Zn2+ transport system ATPase subunit [Oligosphaera ethanolica]
MQDHIVSSNNLSVGYGRDAVLSGVDLQIPHGILLPFVGPNGAGKSTLFNTLLGLQEPLAGSISRDFGDSPPGYVPQQKQLDPLYPVSVRQIVAMGLYPEIGLALRVPQCFQKRLDQTLATFQLDQHQHKRFAELSGGMKQKTLIARAFAANSDVIFLDEPTAGLDAAAETAVLNLLIAMNKHAGKTILIAHHRLEDLSRLAADVCYVNHGHAHIVSADQAIQEQLHPSETL